MLNTFPTFLSPECLAGFEPDGFGGCKLCDVGFFKDEDSNSKCTSCISVASNTTTLRTGANSSDLCGNIIQWPSFILCCC